MYVYKTSDHLTAKIDLDQAPKFATDKRLHMCSRTCFATASDIPPGARIDILHPHPSICAQGKPIFVESVPVSRVVSGDVPYAKHCW